MRTCAHIAKSVQNLTYNKLQWDEVPGLLARDDILLVDVRTDAEHANNGNIRKDALHVPVDELRDRLSEVPRGKTLLVRPFLSAPALPWCSHPYFLPMAFKK